MIEATMENCGMQLTEIDFRDLGIPEKTSIRDAINANWPDMTAIGYTGYASFDDVTSDEPSEIKLKLLIHSDAEEGKSIIVSASCPGVSFQGTQVLLTCEMKESGEEGPHRYLTVTLSRVGERSEFIAWATLPEGAVIGLYAEIL